MNIAQLEDIAKKGDPESIDLVVNAARIDPQAVDALSIFAYKNETAERKMKDLKFTYTINEKDSPETSVTLDAVRYLATVGNKRACRIVATYIIKNPHTLGVFGDVFRRSKDEVIKKTMCNVDVSEYCKSADKINLKLLGCLARAGNKLAVEALACEAKKDEQAIGELVSVAEITKPPPIKSRKGMYLENYSMEFEREFLDVPLTLNNKIKRLAMVFSDKAVNIFTILKMQALTPVAVKKASHLAAEVLRTLDVRNAEYDKTEDHEDNDYDDVDEDDDHEEEENYE